MSRDRRATARDVMKMIREDGIRFLDLKFVDLIGTLQHLTVPSEAVDEDTFRNGFAFDGSSVRGFQKISESDMLLMPDPASVFKDPFFDDPALSVFCDIADPIRRTPYSRDPRGIAGRAERLARSLGLADQVFFGPEIEFFVFDEVRFDQATQHGYYFLNSAAAFWSSGGQEGGPSLGHQAGRKQAYFAAPPVDQYNNLRSKISNVLQQVGLEPELHHHEVGAANVVDRYKKTATFMPKPLLQENGSGMHMNVSLWKAGQNLFYKEGGYADLSPFALQFIGGLLKHAPALCAICSPTTNSYRRLVPGYEAPMNLIFSGRNRSACVRVPVGGSSPKAKRIEFRTPDPSCNPYLGFAALLMAGMDGVLSDIEPPDPVDEDLYALAETERGKAIGRTPASLGEALDALERDHEFLLRGDVFTRDVIDTWIQTKRTDELEYVRLRPHPAEFALYFNV
jgi:glutamine synthetase